MVIETFNNYVCHSPAKTTASLGAFLGSAGGDNPTFQIRVGAGRLEAAG
jgi:hypothetical protein